MFILYCNVKFPSLLSIKLFLGKNMFVVFLSIYNIDFERGVPRQLSIYQMNSSRVFSQFYSNIYTGQYYYNLTNKLRMGK